MKWFRGSLRFLLEKEGYVGKPYWPGGNSGVTLDPGVDLGYADWELVERVYRPLVNDRGWRAMERARGVRGSDAKGLVPVLRRAGIRISEADALALMEVVAEPYWLGIVQRFPVLKRETTPEEVQTAMLSLAYNRGVWNGHVEVLKEPLRKGDWDGTQSWLGLSEQVSVRR